jgi:hypothetical protein
MTRVQFLFTNQPNALVDLGWFDPENPCYSLISFVSDTVFETYQDYCDLETLLRQTTDLPEYGRFFFHFTLTTWLDFLTRITTLNPDLQPIEIHLFSEREQRPFYLVMENNDMKIISYSPYHVAFFDIFEVDFNNDTTYEFNEEKYRSTYSKIKPIEVHSTSDILDDIERYGFVMRT